ncbi:MAG: hypothetical protein WB777_14215 [Mycobacterium sp.]
MSTQPIEQPPQDPAAQQALNTAQGFADRAQTVMQVAPWADHQTVASVAQGTQTAPQAAQTVSQLGDVLAQSWDGFVSSYDDPVLQQQPSLQSAVAGFVHQTSGPPPIAGGTLLQVQGTLQSAGYGKDLSADGAWTQQWQQQLNQAENDQYQTQAAGKKPGSVTTSSVIHSIGHLFTPSGIGDTFIGWAKDVRNLAGDSLATAANVPTDVSDLFSGNLKQTGEGLARLTALPLGAAAESAVGKDGLSNTAAQLGADVQSIGGPHVTANAYTQEQGTWRALSDALTVLSMTGLGGLGKQTIAQVGKDWVRGTLDTSAPELSRGPQVIARTLFNADQSGKLIGSRWLANAPVAGRLAPVVGRIAGQDGWYYQMRTLGAQVYKYPLARAAGTVYSKATVGAIGTRALGEIPGTQYGQNIQDEHVLDALDANLANHGPRLFGMALLDPNNVGMFLHGPLGGAGSASDTVSQAVQSAHQGSIDVIGSKGFGAAMEQALAEGNKLMTRDKQLEAVGGDPFALEQFKRSMAQIVAHDQYIEQQLGHPFQSSSQADIDAAKIAEDKYYRDPAIQVKSLADALQGDTSVSWATNRLHAYFLTRASDPRTALAKSFQEWHDVTKLGQQAYAAGDADHFVTPNKMAAFHESVPPEGLQGEGETFIPNSGTLKTLVPDEPGMYGLARKDYMTAPQGHAQAAEFRQAMPLYTSQDSYLMFNQFVRDWMHENMNRDARSLQVFPTDTLIDQIDKWASGQATDVWINPIDGSPGAQARFQAVKDAGYKWVAGHHIGHVIDGSEPDLGALDGYTTPVRRFIQRAGLDPGAVRDTDMTRATHLSMLHSLVDLRRNDSSVKWGAQVTEHTILGLLTQDKAIEGLQLPWYERTAFSALQNRGVNASVIKQYMDGNTTELTDAAGNVTREATGTMSKADATQKLEQDLAFQQSIRDLPASKIIHTLQHPQTVTTRDGAQWEWPGMDAASAVKTARALNKGYKLPTYMMGWSGIENTARAMQGFPLADKAVARFPDSNLLSAAANWPNNVIRIRNALKFTLNPKFDFQRLMKINAKMALEGVDPVQDALGELQRTGRVDEAQKLLSKVTGQGEDSALDADKYARSQSIFGIMSPQWHAAYFLLKKNDQLQGQIPGSVVRLHRAFDDADPLADRSRGTYYTLFDHDAGPLQAFTYAQRENTALRYADRSTSLVIKDQGQHINAGEGAIRDLAGQETLKRLRTIPVNGTEQEKLNAIQTEITDKWPQLRDQIPASQLDEFPAPGSARYTEMMADPHPESEFADYKRAVASRGWLLRDIYGAQLARDAGYSSIVSDKNGMAEFVDLGGQAKDAAPPRDAGAELKASYNRVFKYGSNGARTALERSVNTVLYPFSFEKTVMRNFGAHFLDHPGQALLLDNAVEEWRKADKNAAVGDFVRSYIPALTELNQLNAFSHGISPGQFGGLNAGLVGPVVATVAHDASTSPSPSQLLLNLFLPQSWGPQYTKANLQKFLPIWKEFAQVWQTSKDEGQVTFNALANARDDIVQNHQQARTLIAPSQQLGIALQTKAAMVAQAQNIITFNDTQTDDASKVPWPADKPLPGGVQGKPIDKTTIGLYVQGLYPAYNPNAAASTVETKAQQALKFIAQVGKTDPQTALDMSTFNTAALQLSRKINANDYTNAELAPIQGAFQQAAEQLAGKNSNWLLFYNRYWKSTLGPITDWTGRGTK